MNQSGMIFLDQSILESSSLNQPSDILGHQLKDLGGVYLLSTRHTTNPNTEIVLIGYFGSSIKTWILENIFPPIDLITDMLWKLAILENYMLK